MKENCICKILFLGDFFIAAIEITLWQIPFFAYKYCSMYAIEQQLQNSGFQETGVDNEVCCQIT